MNSYRPEMLVTLGFTEGPPRPPKYEQFVFHISSSCHIAFLFNMYIDMGERIIGKQYRFTLIIACLPSLHVGVPGVIGSDVPG